MCPNSRNYHPRHKIYSEQLYSSVSLGTVNLMSFWPWLINTIYIVHWYRWNSGDVSSYLINGSNLTPNSIKKFGAVSSLLFGCCDRTSPAVGPLVSKIKVGVLKNMTLSKRAPRPLWSPENLLVFVSALFAPNRSPMDWGIMALQLLCYLSMRMFSDFQNIKFLGNFWKNTKFL